MASVRRYCIAHDIEHRILRDPVLRIIPKASRRSPAALRLGYLPIYEKQHAFDLLSSYDQVGAIDADVYIPDPEAPNIFDEIPPWPPVDFAGVPERSMPITPAYRAKLDRYEFAQYGPLRAVGLPFLQMGVMILNRSILRFLTPENAAREFLAREDFQRFINGEGAWKWSTDQTLMNWWLRSTPGMELYYLDWRFNALYGALLPGKVDEAHFVHFFLSDHLPSESPEELVKAGNLRPRV